MSDDERHQNGHHLAGPFQRETDVDQCGQSQLHQPHRVHAHDGASGNHRQQVGVGHQAFPQGGHAVGHLVLPPLLVELDFDPVKDAVDHQVEQRLLGANVVVQRHGLHPKAPRQFPHGQGIETLLVHQFDTGANDALGSERVGPAHLRRLSSTEPVGDEQGSRSVAAQRAWVVARSVGEHPAKFGIGAQQPPFAPAVDAQLASGRP